MISTAKGLLASDKDSFHTGMARSHTAHVPWPQLLRVITYGTEGKPFLFIAGVYGTWTFTPRLYDRTIVTIIVNENKADIC